MPFYMNFPFFSIMLAMFCAIITAVLHHKIAKWITVFLCSAVFFLSAYQFVVLYPMGESFAYMMGHFPSPFGNEIRGGLLESLLAGVFSLVMLLSVLGGMKKLKEHVDSNKQSLVYVMLDLVLAATLAILYTNDLFTAYVFIEILTISACALIMCRQNGHTLVSAMRYMILSLLGSGMILISIAITYNITGHLLMEPIHDAMLALYQSGSYEVALTVIIGLFFVGLAIKSALFPFHNWLPDAYGFATPTTGAVLSSIVSKAYIILLIKIYYRVIGINPLHHSQALQLLFVFGVAGMIIGSISAINARDLRRMVAFSSVAQIGYIYAGIGMGTDLGLIAALYHLIMHSVAKSGLFIAASALADSSGDSKRFSDLRGAGYRNKTAGVLFTICALSMVGVPILGGFISKLNFSEAAFEHGGITMWVMLIALAVSTLLNVLYFVKTVVTIYRKPREGFVAPPKYHAPLRKIAMWGFIVLNLLIAILALPLMTAITNGLHHFG